MHEHTPSPSCTRIQADRVNFEKTMLKAFESLIANPEYGGAINR